ncbi:methyl-accepting chemotaxis protein [Clostridium botulinum]|nr:methyl-accepting chemotaxis protein [Clostridium botulinum]
MIRSFPFNAVYDANGVPDRAYLAEDFAGYFAKFIGTGVYPNPATGLQVVAVDNNMQIRIKKGDAYILGRDFENTDDYILKLDPADGVLSRIDRVALRLDYLKRDIIPVLKKGNYASSPVAKSLQRDADAYEIALADVYVKNGVISIMQSNITDLRLNKEFCGIVHGVIQQADTTEIFRQFQAWFNEQKNVHEGDFEKWVNEFKIATGKKFTDWVDDLKNSLDPSQDIAAKLQMQISENKLQLADIATKQGDLINLKTTNKTNLVNAVNELFQNANNGKSSIANVVGNPLLATDTFQQQRDKIQTLKNTFASNLNGKGQSSYNTESLKSLIDKVANINTGKRFITGKIYVSEVRSYCGKPSDNPSSMNYITDRTFNRQISCPFEVGFFAVDLDEFTHNSYSNKIHLNIVKDFLIPGFPEYDVGGYHDWRSNFSFYSNGTNIYGSTINVVWDRLKIPLYDISDRLRSSLDWIAIEK